MKHESNDITIKAINHKMQLFLLIFNWLLTFLIFLSNNLGFKIFWIILCILLTIWLLSVNLIISNGRVIYTSGFLKRELLISSIISINSSFNAAGSNFSRDVTIQTSDSQSKDIKFNLRYFSKKDFTIFLNNINKLNQKIIFDKVFEKLINKI